VSKINLKTKSLPLRYGLSEAEVTDTEISW